MMTEKEEILEKLKKLSIDELKKIENNHIIPDFIVRELNKKSDKYITLLKYLNIILKNMGQPEIDDILNFKRINRTDLNKIENGNALMEMKEEIYKSFNKKKLRIYSKNENAETKNVVINTIRALCKELKIDFKSIKYNKTKNNVITSYYLYSINI